MKILALPTTMSRVRRPNERMKDRPAYKTNRVCDDDDDRDDDDDCDESLYTVFNGPMYYYLYLFYGESWAPFGAAADDHDHC